MVRTTLWRKLSARISEDKAKCKMNCAEAVKPAHYAVEPPRKQVPNQEFRRGPNHARNSGEKNADRKSANETSLPKKTNAARGPATLEPHRSWTFKAAFPSLRAAGTTVPVRQRSHSQRAPHLPARLQCRDSKNRCPATSVVASSPTQLKERGERRPQCPGNRHALAHVFDFPPATHARELPVCHRLHRNRRSAQALKFPRTW